MFGCVHEYVCSCKPIPLLVQTTALPLVLQGRAKRSPHKMCGPTERCAAPHLSLRMSIRSHDSSKVGAGAASFLLAPKILLILQSAPEGI